MHFSAAATDGGPRSNPPPRSLSKKPCTVRPLFPTLARPYHGGGLLPYADSLRLTIEASAIRQLVPPEAFKAVRRQRHVTRRVLEIAVPEVMPRLGPCLAALRAVAKSNDPRHRSSGYAWRWYGRHGLLNPPPPSETTEARDFVRAFSCVPRGPVVSPHTIRGCLDPRSRRFAIPEVRATPAVPIRFQCDICCDGPPTDIDNLVGSSKERGGTSSPPPLALSD